ncbi:uncharacterized protein LOC122365091 [Amphibalanus amphitrite]|uniref:uncharacterized protein LOC122365091 n=1 Tax=Amphibalanus amphitrite TaxID=1232801 RepID=UPI001C91FBB8|nr:uncharacterized protein LOC122365091 [Amphibalanus amphitrite]
MAPVLTEPDKDPETPAEHGAAPPPLPRHPRRLGRHLHALLKSNLKNLLADCGAQLGVCAAGGLHSFSPPDVGAMKNVLSEHCKPSNGSMDRGDKLEKEDVMGLHSANSSNLQELLNNKKQFAGSLVARSPPSDLADMIHEFETLAESAPLTSGNGHVPPEEMQMITQLVTSMDEHPPVTAAVVAAPPPPPPVTAAPPPAPVTTPAPAPLTVESMQTRQKQLVGRSARLLRRLRALQVHAARQQTTSQTAALLERLSAAPAAATTSSSAPPPAGATATSLPSPAAAGAGAASGATPAAGDITEMLRSPNVKHFSTTQLVNLVLNNKSASAAASAVAAPPQPPPAPAEGAPCGRPEREVAAAAALPAGVARRQLERLTAAADSDATESSSGGESADEFEPGWDDEAHERAAPIRKRALWRWSSERSALACRWSWLTAQVTDLEFRVRQLRQLHRQLRASNPRPVPGRPTRAAATPSPSPELGGAGDASSAALADRQKASEAIEAGAEDGDGQCARSRPRPSAPRRRVFTVGRAARRSVGGAPARCRCDPGVDSCPICAGRPDCGGRVRPEVQPVRERRALLSAGHHPVLSLPAEAALSLGYDTLLRSSRWQQNHLHARPRGPRLVTKEPAGAAAGGGPPAATPPVTAPPCSRPAFHRRKSGVYKRFYDLDGSEGTPRSSNGRVGRPPKLSRRSRSASVCDARPAAGAGCAPLAADDESPWSSGRQSPERRESRDRSAAAYRAARHRQNSYDIDNIVIPASMASTTKIEKPKYKEIVTPGWRSVELRVPALNGEPAADGPRAPSGSAEAPEPLDDSVFERRHLPAELAERRRLYQAAGKPPGGAAGSAGGGTGPGRGRRAHTPDTPRAAEPSPADPARPRILRYQYLLEPCGFPARRFPLPDRVWKELLASAQEEDDSPSQPWRSPRPRSSSGAEPVPWADDQRCGK